MYKQFYPLLQAAYLELGYPDQQFDDRLQQAIKVLLNAPEISDEPDLTLPSVHYAFADAELEQLGMAQKQMLRLGQANQQRLQNVAGAISVGVKTLSLQLPELAPRIAKTWQCPGAATGVLDPAAPRLAGPR